MSPLLIIVLLLSILILWMLFLRIRVIIDTEAARYEIRLWPLAQVHLHIDDEHIAYDSSVLFYHKVGELYPALLSTEMDDSEVEEVPEAKPEEDKPTKAQSKRLMSLRQGLELSHSLLSSFKVNRFRLLLNTDDAIWNAWLYPVFILWRSKGHDVELRFFGSSELSLDIENALHRVLGALFYNYLIKPLRS